MSEDIRARATAGIYAEVINQIYDSIDKRMREAVSNAFDAGASTVKISVYTGINDKIVIYDDGHGMDKSDLQEKYICMGGGNNYSNEETIGRIGIGALSVFALGDKVHISTRKKGDPKILKAELDFSRITEANEHSTPLDEIKLGTISGYRNPSEEDDEHFTEITITNLSRSAQEIFNDQEKTKQLIEKLERILPVAYRTDDFLFEILSSEILNKIEEEPYTVNVVFHVPHLDYINYKLYRKTIFSVNEVKIKQIYPIHPFVIEESQSNRLSLHGYLYMNAESKRLPKTWQGINTRVKNVTIEKNTFFGYEEDQAARVRIGGELFINNIDENKAIQSNRSGFAVENNDYQLVAQYMEDPIKAAIDIVRKNSNIDSAVKKVIKHLDISRFS